MMRLSLNRFNLVACVSAYLVLLLFATLPIRADYNAPYRMNLYRVDIGSSTEARGMNIIGCTPLMKVRGGYLILIDARQEQLLVESELNHQFIYASITRHSLAVDQRDDFKNIERYETVYEAHGLRLLLVDWQNMEEDGQWKGLAPAGVDNLKIEFRMPPNFSPVSSEAMATVDSIIGIVSVDSCSSYVHQLQDFDGRLSGTPGNYQSRDWLVEQFENFGYDSIVLDNFPAEVDGYIVSCDNVLAYKIGSVNPHHHIVVGAHRDAIPQESPGADDNASGTGGVLEIARALSTVETNMTIVFALFDAEETGLYGSRYYASRAINDQEIIVFMLNLDMIAYQFNDSLAGLTHGENDQFALLWEQLADSIPSIEIMSFYYDGYGSDQQSFQWAGYDMMAAFEENRCPHIHRAQDSAVYLDFSYMSRMTKASLATIYVTDQTYVPQPQVIIRYEGGPPEFSYPGIEAEFRINVGLYAGAEIVPGTVFMYYSVNEALLDSLPMTYSGEGDYTCRTPIMECGDVIFYYFTATEASSGIVYYPEMDSGFVADVATGKDYIFSDHFNINLGWTITGDATDGFWERNTPYGNGISTPLSDFDDGHGQCYNTLRWYNHDVDEGTTTLISPSFDASSGDPLLSYARWYSNDQHYWYPHTDIFEVFISNDDGNSWTLLETVGPVEESSGGWYYKEFLISDYIEPTSQVRLRFDASDLDTDSFVEAAVDAVDVVTLGYDPIISTDYIPEWTVGLPYVPITLEAISCSGILSWVDKFDQLNAIGLALSEYGIVSGTPILNGDFYFTVVVTDDMGQSDEHGYNLKLNQAVSIVTNNISRGTVGEDYSMALNVSGGTGIKSWSDPESGLSGSGLSLSPDGLISGLASDTGQFLFTAHVVDELGAFDDRAFTLNIYLPFNCGDANTDLSVNVGDAVFLINFVFKGGTAPNPLCAGDANGDGQPDVGDAVYLISYVFKSGPNPTENCCPW